MSTNPLNDISRVYLEQVAAVEEGMDMKTFKQQRSRQKQKEKRAAEKLSPTRRAGIHTPEKAPEREARRSAAGGETGYGGALRAKKVRKAKALGELGEQNVQELFITRLSPEEREKKEREKKVATLITLMKHAKDPASDVAKTKKEEKEKPARWWDNDGDNIGYEKGEVSGKFKRKKKVEEANDGNLANNYPPYDKVTRGDVIAGATGKDQMGGKKKKVPKEGYSNWREDLIEVVDKIKKDNGDEKITGENVDNTKRIKINPNIGEAVENLGGTLLEMVEVDEFDYIVESVYDELLDEGYDEDDIEEALEFALTEAKVTFGHDTPTGEKKKKRGNLVAAVGRLARQKLSSKVRDAKKGAMQAVATGARQVAKGALGVARKMEGDNKKPSAVHSRAGTRSASTYRSAGAGQKERVSSGSYTPPTKKKAEKPSDPWEGTATTPPKAKAKPKPKAKAKTTKVSGGTASAPAKPARKRKSKLDNLLADIRSEEVQINEKTLTAAEKKKREEIAQSMNLADFERRYPGRGMEVKMATATKMAKKIAEQAAGQQAMGMGMQPKAQKPEQQDQQQQQKKVTQQRDRQRQQEIQILNRKLQALRSAPKGADTDVTV